MTLTVHLIEGAKWSDGDPFDTEDIRFYWDDVIMDPEVTPLNGAQPDNFGEGTTLEVIDAYTFAFTFTTAFPESVLYQLAYGNFCPGPCHILAPQHPAHGGESYDAFRNAFPPEYLGFPVMGAWVPVEYRPDDIVVLRRNPYYWKVDSEGNQLPYLDEMQYRLSTWADRDVQAVAGTGDFSNLEQAESYVEALRRSAEDTAPARLAFGPRTIGYSLIPNLSGNGWGEPDERGAGRARCSTERGLPDRRQPGDRPPAAGRVPRQGAVHRPVPGRPLRGHRLLRRGLDGLLSLQPRERRGAFRGGGPEDTDGDGVAELPGRHGRRRRTSRSRCSSTATTPPTRTSPRASSPCSRRPASRSSLNTLVGQRPRRQRATRAPGTG